MSDLSQVVPFVAIVSIVAYAAFKVGVKHERDRPVREEDLAFSRGLLFEKVASTAHTELRQHEIRLAEPDDTTMQLLSELQQALRGLISDDGQQVVFQQYEDAERCMDRVVAASDALRLDRKRYDVLLTPEEIERFERYGIGSTTEHKSRTGRLRSDPS